MWETERDEDDGPPTMEEFEEAFMANFIPEEDRKLRLQSLSSSSKRIKVYKSFFKHLEKDIQQRREEKEHNKKSRTSGRFSGTSSGGGMGSFKKGSLAPAQSSHQSGGGFSFSLATFKSVQARFKGCYHCGDSGHIKANCPKLRHNFSGESTRPYSFSATTVVPHQARGSHNEDGHGADRGANRITQEGGQPRLFAILDRSTFSYVTTYFANNLGLEPEQLSEQFLTSTPVSESMKATRYYRGCTVLVQGHITEVDLIELEMVDFDVIIVKFQWLDACEQSFQELKKRLTTAHVLTLPKGSGGFTLYCDASRVGLGCVLMQDEKVIAYAST
ncbi:uncharacterized protein [Nicotiana tomentosiformis]|uniref:uncharacterized protein n=1 Tax=Nicotiana tomentosiformis TaxID=4098 RepID=UPI00388CE7BB